MERSAFLTASGGSIRFWNWDRSLRKYKDAFPIGHNTRQERFIHVWLRESINEAVRLAKLEWGPTREQHV
jgi:hypothetical protein